MTGRTHPRGRDRRGRGPRGGLVPPEVPLHRTPSEEFDELVLDAVEHLEERWADELEGVELAVEAVPPDDEPSPDGEAVALGRLEPAIPGTRGIAAQPARIVLYRHPIEARGADPEDTADLVLDVLIHEVARMLNVEPEVIDPEGHGFDEDDED